MKNIIPNLNILNKIKTDLIQGKTLILFTSIQTAGSVIRMISPLVIAGIFTENMWGRYSLCEPVVFFFSALFILSARNPFIVYANEERSQTGFIRKTFSAQCIFLAVSIVLFLAVIFLTKSGEYLFFNSLSGTFSILNPTPPHIYF